MLKGAGYGQRELVRHGHVRVEIRVQATAGSRRQGDPAAVLVAGLHRDDVDRAADGIAPVQGALRPAQYLDALDVRKAPVLPDLAAEVDAVDVHADARVGRDQVVLDRKSTRLNSSHSQISYAV